MFLKPFTSWQSFVPCCGWLKSPINLGVAAWTKKIDTTCLVACQLGLSVRTKRLKLRFYAPRILQWALWSHDVCPSLCPLLGKLLIRWRLIFIYVIYKMSLDMHGMATNGTKSLLVDQLTLFQMFKLTTFIFLTADVGRWKWIADKVLCVGILVAYVMPTNTFNIQLSDLNTCLNSIPISYFLYRKRTVVFF